MKRTVRLWHGRQEFIAVLECDTDGRPMFARTITTPAGEDINTRQCSAELYGACMAAGRVEEPPPTHTPTDIRGALERLARDGGMVTLRLQLWNDGTQMWFLTSHDAKTIGAHSDLDKAMAAALEAMFVKD